MSRVIHKTTIPVDDRRHHVRLPFGAEVTAVSTVPDDVTQVDLWYAFDPSAGGYDFGATHTYVVVGTGHTFDGAVVGTARAGTYLVWHLIDEGVES